MKLESSAFREGESIPQVYTCQGEEINPPLEISEVPSNAKSLVLIMDDPDVPKQVREDGLWVHWVVFNIDPRTTQIKENASSFGTMGVNTGKKQAYQGPCPPDREHRYFFKLYALDTTLNLKAGATKDEVEETIKGHIIEQANLMGRYKKS